MDKVEFVEDVHDHTEPGHVQPVHNIEHADEVLTEVHAPTKTMCVLCAAMYLCPALGTWQLIDKLD